MKIEYVDELLFANIKITYKGKTKNIDNVIVDTGAAHSLLSVDSVSDIDISVNYGESIVTMYGIGGEDYKSQILEVLKLAQPFEDFYETFRQEGRNEGLKEGRDEGLKEGRDEGLKEGRDEGRIDANREAAARILNKKFGLKSLELQNLVKAINNEVVLFRIIEEVPFSNNIKAEENY